MLGVEHRQVLIRDSFQACSTHLASQRGDLIGIQVVARCDALQSEFQECIGAQRIRNVETEVAGQCGKCSATERIYETCCSNQQWTVETQQEVDDSLLTR